uniref:Uncharacterized protein n=1 Tax=Octopus bimaculoides TaxID=37653 RepID=A0A0L8FLC8_OCTBM
MSKSKWEEKGEVMREGKGERQSLRERYKYKYLHTERASERIGLVKREGESDRRGLLEREREKG